MASDLVFAGRLIREKNAGLLVRAMHILVRDFPDLRLTIAGDGPEREAIRLLVRDLSLEGNITTIGFLDSHDDLIALMKSSKVFVLPSVREGFGIAALEALGCGLPVVTIDHPANAIRDLITEKTGFLCAPTPDDLAAAIRNALSSHQQMRDACKTSAESYDWDRIVDKAGEYYLALATRQIP